MDVAGGHAAQLQAGGERGERAVAGTVPGEERALQLDAQPLATKGLAQSPHALLVVHAVLRAAGQADQSLGVGADRLERDGGSRRVTRALAGVGVSERQQPAQIAPALLHGDQQRQVAAVGKAQLGAVDRAQSESAGGVCELHRAVDPVVVGQRERPVTELECCGGELLGQRGAVEEGIGGVAMQLGVGDAHRWRNQRPLVRSWKTTRSRPDSLTTSQ